MAEKSLIGERLHVALEGVDLDALARDADIPRDVLSRVLAGDKVAVSTAALGRVATRLGLRATSLWDPDGDSDVTTALLFRHGSVPDFFHADESVARRALGIATQVDGLSELLGRVAPFRHGWFDEPMSVGDVPYKDGYRRAQRVREILASKEWLPSATAPLPDPLDGLIEDAFGIPVLDFALESASVLAFTVKDLSNHRCAIVINRASGWASNALRRRVDLAHELSHALLDTRVGGNLGMWVDRSEDEEAPPNAGNRVEQRARAFAAELLIPKAGLMELLGPRPATHPSLQTAVQFVQRTRNHFRTTVELTAHHLANQSYFPEHLHDAVVKAAGQELGGLASPTPPPTGRPLLERLVRDALSATLITRMRAREILGLSAWDKLPWNDE